MLLKLSGDPYMLQCFWIKYAKMFKTNLIVVIYINIYFAIITNSELGKNWTSYFLILLYFYKVDKSSILF